MRVINVGELNNIYEQNELDTRNHLLIMNSSIISNSLIELDSFIYHFYGSKIELDSFIYYFYGDKNRKPVYDKLYQLYLSIIQKKIWEASSDLRMTAIHLCIHNINREAKAWV